VSVAPQTSLRDTLRQMLAVLEAERQALAGLDIDAVMGAANDKMRLCGTLDDACDIEIDEECQGLLVAAKRLNEVNRQVRNLVAANVTARLNAITGSPQIYRAGPHTARLDARLGRA